MRKRRARERTNVWLVFLEVKPYNNNVEFTRMDGAFINVLVPAATEEEAVLASASELRKLKFKIVRVADTRYVGYTKKHFESTLPRLKKLAAHVLDTKKPQLSTFRYWKK
jgi:hypothetical protein